MLVQPADCLPVMRRRDDPFIMLFTSGTTGKPKGVVYPLFSLLQFAMFMRSGLDLREDDIYWCFADPGWALGMIGTLTAPLLLGCTTVMFEGAFSVEFDGTGGYGTRCHQHGRGANSVPNNAGGRHRGGGADARQAPGDHQWWRAAEPGA